MGPGSWQVLPKPRPNPTRTWVGFYFKNPDPTLLLIGSGNNCHPYLREQGLSEFTRSMSLANYFPQWLYKNKCFDRIVKQSSSLERLYRRHSNSSLPVQMRQLTHHLCCYVWENQTPPPKQILGTAKPVVKTNFLFNLAKSILIKPSFQKKKKRRRREFLGPSLLTK